MEYGSRIVREEDEETLGEAQTVKGLAFPKSEKKKKKQTSPTRKRVTERGRTSKHRSNRGRVLKGWAKLPNTTPARRRKRLNNQPKNNTRDQNRGATKRAIKVSRDVVTAGWRGPWAALPFSGNTPGDRGIKKSEDPPTTGTAPGSANASTMPNKTQIPQKVWATKTPDSGCGRNRQTPTQKTVPTRRPVWPKLRL